MEVRNILWNAYKPIEVTDKGIVMEVTAEDMNALAEILVTLYIIPLRSVIIDGIVLAPEGVEPEFEPTVASVILVV